MTFTLSDAQYDAVKQIVAWYRDPYRKPVFYLAGYAGTGKSTIFRAALEELRRHGCKTHALATFTGKAASVLRKKGNPDATTIHSLCYIPEGDEDEAEIMGDGFAPAAGLAAEPRAKRDPNDLKFTLNVMGPASEVDLIGLDECSMVDDPMGADVLCFGKPVLVMGDPGQLPPVGKGDGGPGFFTKMQPDVMLTEVHRQALESPILRLATRARNGEPIPFGEVDAGESGFARVVKLTRATEHHVLRQDTQVLVGVHKVRREVTKRIRHSRGFAGMPMAGETILCGKNNRERKLFNGLQGILTKEPVGYQRRAGDDALMSSLLELEVHMDDHFEALECTAHPWMFEDDLGIETEQPRMRRGIEFFGFGYALTCHKAQGSEWADVTVVDDSGAFREDRHRWLYTAITRAADRLTILRRG